MRLLSRPTQILLKFALLGACIGGVTVPLSNANASATAVLAIVPAANWQSGSLLQAPYPLAYSVVVTNQSATAQNVSVSMSSPQPIVGAKTSTFSQCGSTGGSSSWSCEFALNPKASNRIGILIQTRFDLSSYQVKFTAKTRSGSTSSKSVLQSISTTGIPAGSNGCGPSGKGWAVPDHVGVVSFTAACNLHDYCYGGADSTGHIIDYDRWTARGTCDSNLESAMQSDCHSAKAIAQSVLFPEFEADCLASPPVYYAAVEKFGSSPYVNGHDGTCKTLVSKKLIPSSTLSTCLSTAKSLAGQGVFLDAPAGAGGTVSSPTPTSAAPIPTTTAPPAPPTAQSETFVVHGGTTGTRSLNSAGTYGCACVSSADGIAKWGLVSNNFKASDFGFTWPGNGQFTVSPSKAQIGKTIEFSYRVIANNGVASNEARVTIEIE
jgi:hypothetical protein